MKMNKTGKVTGMGVLVTLALLVVIVAGVGISWVVFQSGAQQTAVQTPTAVDIPISSQGKSASARVFVYDREAKPHALVAIPFYAWDKQTPTILSADGTTSSTTARTNVQTTTGKILQFISYQVANYYGKVVDVPIDTESVDVDLDVYNVVPNVRRSGMQLDAFDRDDNSISASIAMVGSETYTLSRLRIIQNNSVAAFNLKLIAINSSKATSDIDSVVVNPLAKVSCPLNEVRNGTFTWCYELATPIMLHEFDQWNSGTVPIKASGSNPSETLTWKAVDWAEYKASKGSNANSITYGYEDDADTPADVGALNILSNFTIT